MLQSCVNCVKFHPDGTCIASCSADRTVKLWDLRTNQLLQHYDAHDDIVNQIAFHPSGNFLSSVSNDGTLKIYDLCEGHLLYTVTGHTGPITSITYSNEGYEHLLY